jgi:hypothetical protein
MWLKPFLVMTTLYHVWLILAPCVDVHLPLALRLDLSLTFLETFLVIQHVICALKLVFPCFFLQLHSRN